MVAVGATDEGQVEGAEVMADVLEPVSRTGVAREVHRVPRASQAQPAQSVWLRTKRPEKCRASAGQDHVPDGRGLSPSSAVMRSGWHAPALEVQVDTDRHDVLRTVKALELGDGGLVEMVVVVVAGEDRVEGRQVSRPGTDSGWRRRGPTALDGTLTEHRVELERWPSSSSRLVAGRAS